MALMFGFSEFLETGLRDLSPDARTDQGVEAVKISFRSSDEHF
jgi:hypothetical protein